MVRQVETATGTVNVELDAAAGRMILVQCPVHGRMAESMEQQAYICTADGCGRRYTRLEAEQTRQDGFDEIAAADRRSDREDAAIQRQRREDRFAQHRQEKE